MSNLVEINFDKALDYSKEEIQKIIVQLEEALKNGEQIEIPCEHTFANKGTDKGLYVREIKIPAGALIIGKIHKFETLNFVTQGELSVLSIDGVMRLKVGDKFVSSPEAKRVIYAHTESAWTTVHATPEQEIEKIESIFVTNSFEELETQGKESLCHSSQ